MRQATLASVGFGRYGKTTRRAAFLNETIRQHVYGSGVVLVVDDETESRQIARRHLDKLGGRSPRPRTAPPRSAGSSSIRARR